MRSELLTTVIKFRGVIPLPILIRLICKLGSLRKLDPASGVLLYDIRLAFLLHRLCPLMFTGELLLRGLGGV